MSYLLDVLGDVLITDAGDSLTASASSPITGTLTDASLSSSPNPSSAGLSVTLSSLVTVPTQGALSVIESSDLADVAGVVVQLTATTTDLTSSRNPSAAGDAVTFSATVDLVESHGSVAVVEAADAVDITGTSVTGVPPSDVVMRIISEYTLISSTKRRRALVH